MFPIYYTSFEKLELMSPLAKSYHYEGYGSGDNRSTSTSPKITAI